jgi:predicted DNA-binding transcriptional regulator YafY
MDKFDRIFQLHAILRSRRTPVAFEDLKSKLECSKSTLHRAIATLTDRLHAPVVFDPDAGGYRYADSKGIPAFELPGLWFTAHELQALAVIQRLLKDVGGGLLEENLRPLSKRLDELTKHRRLNLGEASSRLRFPAIAARPAGHAFQTAASATLQRKKLRIKYHARGSDQRTERTVSPQRLTHYRESWYLDAWDEDKQDHRSFSIDRILELTILNEPAKNVPEAQLDEHYATSYGIFSGKPDKVAVLHFTPERARWVAAEQWHPQQESKYLTDGTYQLRIPYRDHRELVMDILRHGPHVKVIEPRALLDQVQSELKQALAKYAPKPG